jgi:sugar phosphate isomerase/epimerase
MRHDVCYTLTKTGRGRSFDMMLPTIAKYTRKLTEYAATLGIRTCSENHGFIAQDSDRVERLFNAVNHENYGLLVDMGNFLCVDENPITAVSRVAPYAFHVHAKDFRYSDLNKGILTRGGNYIYGCVIGEGVVPVKQCLTAIKRTGYDGFVSIEFEGSEDCIAGITKGLNNLKAYIAAI